MALQIGKSPAMISVGFPLFKSGEVAKIGLESLCSQVAPNVPWELIVAEEITEPKLNWHRLTSYADRLKEAGCVHVEIETTYPIPITTKYKTIASNFSGSSQIFLAQDGDDWSGPQRLAQSWELMSSNPNCNILSFDRGIFYDVSLDTFREFSINDTDRDSTPSLRCGLFPVWRSQTLREIKDIHRPNLVFSWILSWLSSNGGINPLRATDLPGSLFTSGWNRITKKRIILHHHATSPFSLLEKKVSLSDFLPEHLITYFQQQSLEQTRNALISILDQLDPSGNLYSSNLKNLQEKLDKTKARAKRLRAELDRTKARAERLRTELDRKK